MGGNFGGSLWGIIDGSGRGNGGIRKCSIGVEIDIGNRIRVVMDIY